MGALLAREPLRPYTSRWLCFGLLGKPRPSYLTECWRYPSTAFPPPASQALPEGAEQPDLLFLPMTDWHSRIQRTQHLALGLAAAGHRCFYLNPHLGFQFRRIYCRERGHRISTLAAGLYELHLRLPREPVVHHRMATSRECGILADALGRLMRAAGVKKLVQLVSLPFWLGVAVKLRREYGFPIVYDCHDLLSGFRNMRREVVAAEADLLECSDLALFSSQPLLDAKLAEFPSLRGKSLLVRNAAAGGYGALHGEAVPARSRSGPEKVIGYVGALDEWFDMAAVKSAALRQPDWKFVLIGRIENRAVLALKELPNVVLSGEAPHSELAAHLADFDVALIPFLVNELTVAANPIKLYEYLSFGLPVVSTRLPEVEMFGDLVYIAGGPEDFARKVEEAAGENDSLLRQRRADSVRGETWASRVRQIEEALASRV